MVGQTTTDPSLSPSVDREWPIYLRGLLCGSYDTTHRKLSETTGQMCVYPD